MDPITNNEIQNTNFDEKLFSSLFTPSSLSGLLCVLISFFSVASIALITNYQGSSFQQDILRSQAQIKKTAVSEDYGYINENLKQNVLIDRAPVLVFWMFIGALMYFTLTGIASAISSANEIEEELHFVHIRRKELLREVYIKSLLRLGILAVWLIFIILFFRFVLPYNLALAHIGAGNIVSASGVTFTSLAFLGLTLSLHLHVIMFRLLALRPRIFSQETSF